MARFTNRESTIFIACDPMEAVGFLQLYPSFSSTLLARTFILNDLYVRPEARRNGVARKLLVVSEEFARAQDAVRLTLSTAIANGQAQALYLAMGWKKDEQFHIFHRAIGSIPKSSQ